jgi:hypothetical protein
VAVVLKMHAVVTALTLLGANHFGLQLRHRAVQLLGQWAAVDP